MEQSQRTNKGQWNTLKEQLRAVEQSQTTTKGRWNNLKEQKRDSRTVLKNN